jgi:hypothetical protein
MYGRQYRCIMCHPFVHAGYSMQRMKVKIRQPNRKIQWQTIAFDLLKLWQASVSEANHVEETVALETEK